MTPPRIPPMRVARRLYDFSAAGGGAGGGGGKGVGGEDEAGVEGDVDIEGDLKGG